MTDASDSRFTRTMNRFFDWVADEEEEEEVVRVHIEHYIHDRSIKERLYIFMIRDLTTSFWLRLLRFSVKIASCILYVAMSIKGGIYCASDGLTVASPRENCSAWLNLLWVERETYFWALQFIVAVLCLIESALLVYIHSSGFRVWVAFDIYIVLDILVGVPFILALFYSQLQKLWVPSYLNCWSAKFVIERMFYDLHRSSQSHRYARERKLLILLLTLFCLVFTSGCTIHHLQKVDEPKERWNLFVSFWFIVVTFSTVGYGNIVPELWPTRLFVVGIIVVALVVVPKQVNDYLEIRKSQRRQGEATAFAVPGRHVIVCGTELRQTDLKDFLSEFYAYKERVREFTIVILTPNEMTEDLKLLIQLPLWSRRVLYLQGSALKEQDLLRARIHDAEGCFLLVNRRSQDRDRADQRTVLRAWAIAEVAPNVPLFVQVLKPETKPLVSASARAVVCEGELKYALLANNCHCKGISTVVTLLLHTSREKKGSPLVPWHELYGSCSGNEIYSVVVGESRVFRTFAGKNFLFTSVIARRKYAITLIGVRRDGSSDILLNPGRRFILQLDDICYYISIAREENSKFIAEEEALPHVKPALRRTLAFAGAFALDLALPATFTDTDIVDVSQSKKSEETGATEIETGAPSAAFQLGHGEGLQSYCKAMRNAESHVSRSSDEVAKEIQRLRAIAVGKGSGIGQKHGNKKEEEHFEGNQHRKASTVVSSLIQATLPSLGLGLSTTDAAEMVQPPRITGHDKEIIELGDVSHVPRASHAARNFHGMDALAVKAEGQRKKRGFLQFPRHLTAHHGSLTSLSTGQSGTPIRGSDIGSSRSSLLRPSHGGSQSSLVKPPSIAAPVALDDVIEEELSDEEIDELKDLEAGSVSDSSGIIDDMLPEPGVNPSEYVKGVPSNDPYLGVPTLKCYLLQERPPLCCLNLTEPCDHYPDSRSVMSNWKTQSVIISGQSECNSLYHFILPLRAHYIPACALKPIVLLLENKPEKRFLESVSCFPNIYYLVGSVNNVDDLLQAGILCATAIVVARSYDLATSEDAMVDAENIIALQKIFKLFPTTNVVTELSSRQNMRFTKFRWTWRSHMSVEEEDAFAVERQQMYKWNGAVCSPGKSIFSPGKLSADHMTYMFRPAFAAGIVFTASMLDTLLYQSYVKPWIIALIEQLLGCQNVNGSGFLWQVPVDDSLASLKTYGRVCQRLAKRFGLLVFGVYRTMPVTKKETNDECTKQCKRIIQDRMKLLCMDGEPPKNVGQSDRFALVNPKPDLDMQPGDLLYVICPGKYVASEDEDNVPEDDENVQDDGPADNMRPLPNFPLPSYESFDIGLENTKEKEISGSRSRFMWSISRFLFRRSDRSQTNVRAQTHAQDVNKMSGEEKQDVERVFAMTTV